MINNRHRQSLPGRIHASNRPVLHRTKYLRCHKRKLAHIRNIHAYLAIPSLRGHRYNKVLLRLFQNK
jgi:hypothetical protein